MAGSLPKRNLSKKKRRVNGKRPVESGHESLLNQFDFLKHYARSVIYPRENAACCVSIDNTIYGVRIIVVASAIIVLAWLKKVQIGPFSVLPMWYSSDSL